MVKLKMDEKRQVLVMKTAGALCLIAALGGGAFAFWKLRDIVVAPAAAAVPQLEFAAAVHIAAEDWAVFAPAQHTAADERTPAQSGRFRLAGIFGIVGDEGDQRRAILDDLQTKEQTLVAAGEKISGWSVAAITAENVTLTRGAERQTLAMGFSTPAETNVAAAAPVPEEDPLAEPEETVLEETPYGKKVGDTRWVLNKRAMQGYYQQLLDNPERIAALYMSLKPVYNGKEIEGYHLNQEGEKDFFKAMGLTEGDVVRKVNSMNMTSQARAEYFIGEFVKDRLGALVLDIERGGKPEKLIYLFR